MDGADSIRHKEAVAFEVLAPVVLSQPKLFAELRNRGGLGLVKQVDWHRPHKDDFAPLVVPREPLFDRLRSLPHLVDRLDRVDARARANQVEEAVGLTRARVNPGLAPPRLGPDEECLLFLRHGGHNLQKHIGPRADGVLRQAIARVVAKLLQSPVLPVQQDVEFLVCSGVRNERDALLQLRAQLGAQFQVDDLLAFVRQIGRDIQGAGDVGQTASVVDERQHVGNVDRLYHPVYTRQMLTLARALLYNPL